MNFATEIAHIHCICGSAVIEYDADAWKMKDIIETLLFFVRSSSLFTVLFLGSPNWFIHMVGVEERRKYRVYEHKID